MYDISRIVVDLCPEEDDTVHHQSREDIHLCDVHRAFLNDRRRDVATLHLHIAIKCKGIHPQVTYGKLLEFVHFYPCSNRAFYPYYGSI